MNNEIELLSLDYAEIETRIVAQMAQVCQVPADLLERRLPRTEDIFNLMYGKFQPKPKLRNRRREAVMATRAKHAQ